MLSYNEVDIRARFHNVILKVEKKVVCIYLGVLVRFETLCFSTGIVDEHILKNELDMKTV